MYRAIIIDQILDDYSQVLQDINLKMAVHQENGCDSKHSPIDIELLKGIRYQNQHRLLSIAGSCSSPVGAAQDERTALLRAVEPSTIHGSVMGRFQKTISLVSKMEVQWII